MSYYQITADLNDIGSDDASDTESGSNNKMSYLEAHHSDKEELDLEKESPSVPSEDEDPNWLYLAIGSSAASICEEMNSMEQSPEEAASSNMAAQELGQQPPAVKMRQKVSSSKGNNNIKQGSYAHRLSKLWDGISSYVSLNASYSHTAYSPDALVGLESKAKSRNEEAFLSTRRREEDNHDATSAVPLPEAIQGPSTQALQHDLNPQVPITSNRNTNMCNPDQDDSVDEDHVVTHKITELFQVVRDIEADEDAIRMSGLRKAVSNSNSGQIRRRVRANPATQNLKRKTHSVSGYFSDWTKWLTTSSDSIAHNHSSNPHQHHCYSESSRESDYVNNNSNGYASSDTSTHLLIRYTQIHSY